MNRLHKMDASSARVQVQSPDHDLLMPVEASERGQVGEQRQERDTAPARARELEAMLAAMADGVLVFDRDGRLLHENPAARELLGLHLRAAGLPRTIHQLARLIHLRDEVGQPLPDEQRPSIRVLRGETLHGASAMDVMFSAYDGCDVVLNVSGAPIRGPDGNGQVVGGVLIMRDVTERRQLERQAHAAERERLRLRTLLDVLPVAVGMMDTQARVLENNPANKALWGEDAPVSGEIPQVQTWHGWWPDTGKPLAPEEWATMRALTSGETIINQEVEFETSSGQRKVVLASAAPIRDEHGAIVGVTGIHQDITERKRLEAALRQAERDAEARASQLEAILEAMADGVVVFDRSGRILHENPAAWKLLNLDGRTEGLPRTIGEMGQLLNVRDEDGQPLPEAQWPPLRALRGETVSGAGAMDILVRAPDGRDLLVNQSAAPIHDTTGQVAGGVLISRDVTERRRLERRTHEALDALLAMAEVLVQAPEQAEEAPADRLAIPSPAPEAACAQWPANETARRLVELAQSVLGGERFCLIAIDEATGTQRPVATIRPTADEERLWWANVPRHRVQDYIEPALLARLRAGEVVLINLMLPPPDAACNRPTYGGHAALVAPLRLRERLAGLLVLTYGSEQHTATAEERALAGAVATLATLVLERERLLGEREAARATALALTETNQRMDEFLGGATHELKTPLTSTSLSVALAARRVRSLLAQVSAPESSLAGQLAGLQGLMTGAEASLERLSRLVVDLLDVSRIRAGQLEFRLEPCDLAALVRDAVEEQRRIAPTRVMHLRLPSTLPVPVVADADRIRQVVTNYLTNALKYSPEDRPVEVRVQVREGQARVSVRDEGPGLPAAEQRRIWERYHRVRGVSANAGADASAGGGLGLGLYISRTIVERHQGAAGVRSAPGKGSTFWFALPLAGEPSRVGKSRQTA